ncbi:MAG: Zn-dependent protease [Bacteroidota bacterium]
MKLSAIFFPILALLLLGFPGNPNPKASQPDKQLHPGRTILVARPVVIDIIPFSDVPADLTEYVYGYLSKIYTNVSIQPAIPLPRSTYYAARGRYRADSLIRQLASRTEFGHVTLALTTKDISTTNGNFPDWGIFGLSYCPGKACVASIFRIKGENREEQFFKVAIHELGHTQGLDHCPGDSCFMRDAEGKNHMNEETEFCPKCRKTLIKAGWIL